MAKIDVELRIELAIIVLHSDIKFTFREWMLIQRMKVLFCRNFNY
jgi:hypothetical protein